MKVFYDSRQSVAANSSFSPSAQKPTQVVKSWKRLGIPYEERTFAPLTAEKIALAHDPDYVAGVLACKRNNGFGNKNPEVAKALPWVCGSMAAAALHALTTRETSFSPTSGAHHAGYAHGGGYCTFNFLVIAAILAHRNGAKRVGIIDLDRHYGDGSDDIIRKLDLSFITHYTFGALSVQKGLSAERWLARLSGDLKQFSGCDLLIVNAGVDSHLLDPLGGILTTGQMARRDHIIFNMAHTFGVPICVSLAGGYQKTNSGSIAPVLRLHDTTFATAWSIMEANMAKAA